VIIFINIILINLLYYSSYDSVLEHGIGGHGLFERDLDAYVYEKEGAMGMYIQFMHPPNDVLSNVFYEFMDSLKVKNTTYHNIKIFTNLMKFSNIKYQRIYYSKNVGVIKRKIITLENDTIVWELKEYHINN